MQNLTHIFSIDHKDQNISNQGQKTISTVSELEVFNLFEYSCVFSLEIYNLTRFSFIFYHVWMKILVFESDNDSDFGFENFIKHVRLNKTVPSQPHLRQIVDFQSKYTGIFK